MQCSVAKDHFARIRENDGNAMQQAKPLVQVVVSVVAWLQDIRDGRVYEVCRAVADGLAGWLQLLLRVRRANPCARKARREGREEGARREGKGREQLPLPFPAAPRSLPPSFPPPLGRAKAAAAGAGAWDQAKSKEPSFSQGVGAKLVLG